MNKSRKFAAFLVIAVILSGICSGALAQDNDDEEPGMYIEKPRLFFGGLVAGANFSQIDGDYYAGYHHAGLNAGGIMYARIVKHVALSLEILYAQKGSKSNFAELSPHNADITVVKYGINLNYAEIPIMINYFDQHKSHFGAGVAYSRLVSSQETMTYDSSNTLFHPDFNLLYPFKKNAFDFVAGADLHLWQGLYLNVRFQYSLIPVRTQLPPPDFARAAQYSNLWLVRVMYLVNK